MTTEVSSTLAFGTVRMWATGRAKLAEKRYWFAREPFDLLRPMRWTWNSGPVSWEGWATIAMSLTALIAAAAIIFSQPQLQRHWFGVVLYFVSVAVVSAVYATIATKQCDPNLTLTDYRNRKVH